MPSNVVAPSTSKFPVTFKFDEMSTSPLKTSYPLRLIAAYGVLITFELMIRAFPIYPCEAHW